jgi:hypothetical protein
MAGGWVQAAHLPAEEALAWAQDHLRERKHSAHTDALKIWAATLPAYAMGGDPPPPPEPPED